MENLAIDRITPFCGEYHPVILLKSIPTRSALLIVDHPPPEKMASQAKDRHSAQLARSLTEFNQTIAQTKSLLEDFSTDLSAMRTLTAIHVSQYASFCLFSLK